ncbi:hypothetical protein OPV22_010119 [Ensete ventricosum]|uniref:Uncharacterized protein n=1 Tax=Ensete ventricosum TaxID=4639 RepID=A0AAV8REX8_ENSVE|nr:hypothetical protein OPV22_010119 [Ensete ventricosum]
MGSSGSDPAATKRRPNYPKPTTFICGSVTPPPPLAPPVTTRRRVLLLSNPLGVHLSRSAPSQCTSSSPPPALNPKRRFSTTSELIEDWKYSE